MSKEYTLLEDEVLKKAEKILDGFGMDVQIAVRMMLKRVIKEKSIAFLLPQELNINSVELNPVDVKTKKEKMSKTKAMTLLRNAGVMFWGNTTFASKNNSADFYWANPDFSVLDEQWNLILNDWNNRRLHLFVIPKKAISHSEMIARADKPNAIDIQIIYGDKRFTDGRSKLSFSKYLMKTVEY